MFATLTLILSAVAMTVAQPPLVTTVAGDDAYCNGATSLSSTACSTGANGLITKGFTTFGSLPSFPLIAGSALVEGFNSTQCGVCYELFYTPTDGSVPHSIWVTAVNTAPEGFTLCTDTLTQLTGIPRNQIPASIPVEVRVVPAADCGFN